MPFWKFNAVAGLPALRSARSAQVYHKGKIMGEHRTISGQGNLPPPPARRRRFGRSARAAVKAHEATTPGRGSQSCRTCGDNTEPRPEPQQLLAIDIAADILGCPIGQHDLVQLDALGFVAQVEDLQLMTAQPAPNVKRRGNLPMK